MITRETEAAALLALLQSPLNKLGWGATAARVSADDTARDLLHELYEQDGTLFRSPDMEELLETATRQLRLWLDDGYQLTTVLESDYPRRLRDIREMPPFLFYSGDLLADDDGMSIVGSRRASSQGRTLARDIAELLVDESLTVISGLAEGIDTAAHRAALDTGGRTVAFIGTGITRHYPASSAALQDEIAQSGLILSQFYPDAPPTKSTFPMRNVSMSGYGLATIIVEASEHSGSRIQARVAGKHGRPVILTTRVVNSTSWGSALVEKPNVYVVGSTDELRWAIREVRKSPAQLDGAIEALVTS